MPVRSVVFWALSATAISQFLDKRTEGILQQTEEGGGGGRGANKSACCSSVDYLQGSAYLLQEGGW